MNVEAEAAEKWAWSRDEENFHGGCASAEEAFLCGLDESDPEDDECIYVGRVVTPDPARGLFAQQVLECIGDNLDETPEGCDPLPAPSPDQLADLTDALRAAYRGWLERHPDQRPEWFTIGGKVLSKTAAEIRGEGEGRES